MRSFFYFKLQSTQPKTKHAAKLKSERWKDWWSADDRCHSVADAAIPKMEEYWKGERGGSVIPAAGLLHFECGLSDQFLRELPDSPGSLD